MSRNYWVISDTHFGHENILTFKKEDGRSVRPFSTVEEMNECMVEGWNMFVKPGDYVYHLGDVFFGPKEDFLNLWPRLKGKKRLVVGNHDDIPWMVTTRDRTGSKLFQKIQVEWFRKEFHVLMTHRPVHQSSLYESKRYDGIRPINVHGHIHQNPAPSFLHYCVSVEQTFYSPVNLETIRDYAKGLTQ